MNMKIENRFKEYTVLYSPKRSKRPKVEKKDKICPFCRGFEHLTPPTILQFPSKGQWKIRIFENKFPAVTTSSKKAYGYHEVIIDSWEHEKEFWQYSNKHLINWISLILTRIKQILKDKKIKYVIFFKNHGKNAGASIAHEHSQLIALDYIPKKISHRAKYLRNKATCIVCKMIKKNKKECVFAGKYFKVFLIGDSFFEVEYWIVHKKHEKKIFEFSEKEFDELFKIVKSLIVFHKVDYNFAFDLLKNDKRHFVFTFIPRVKTLAGFEMISGDSILGKNLEEIRKKIKTFLQRRIKL